MKFNLENLMKANCLQIVVELALSKNPYKIKGNSNSNCIFGLLHRNL